MNLSNRQYQDSGGADTLAEANNAVASARANTPENVRHEFQAVIRKYGAGYEWYWMLR